MSGIADTRRWVYDIVNAGVALPVLRWLPEAANELPCFVVGRPDLDEDPTHRGLQAITVPVYVLGRTLRDDAAQSELDDLADELERLLWKPPQEPDRSGRMTRMRATVANVGNVEVPAYTATVIVTTAPC